MDSIVHLVGGYIYFVGSQKSEVINFAENFNYPRKQEFIDQLP